MGPAARRVPALVDWRDGAGHLDLLMPWSGAGLSGPSPDSFGLVGQAVVALLVQEAPMLRPRANGTGSRPSRGNVSVGTLGQIGPTSRPQAASNVLGPLGLDQGDLREGLHQLEPPSLA
eukprot:2088319-Pyramimonas_sp.AAC.1